LFRSISDGLLKAANYDMISGEIIIAKRGL
jgi:hypothetical protein